LITAYSQPKSRKTARSHAKAEEVPAWSRWWFLAILFLYLIQPLCSLCPLWLDSETENLTSVHDADGNTTTRSYSASGRAQTLIWDGLGRLIKVAERNGSNDGYDWSAKYDGANRRLVTSYQKITANLPSPNSQLLTTQSFFDPQVEFLEIGLTTEDTESTETFWKVYGPDANGVYGGLQGIGGLEAIHRVSASETTGVIADYFGHATARTDGTVVTWADASLSGYGPLPGSLALPVHQSGDLATSVSWQGRYIDPTGYFCVGARYYEPNSGRFISADPLGHEASMDLYSYASGDPINFADPDGRFASGIYNGVGNNGNFGISSPSSDSFYTGNIIGSAFGGYYEGLGGGASQMVMGEYSNRPQTWDSVAGQIGVGLTPAGVAADIRDWSKAGTDLWSGDGSWGSFGIATVFLLPGASEINKTFKLAGETGDLMKFLPSGGGNRPFAMGVDNHLDNFASAHGADTWKQFDDVMNWQPQVLDRLSNPNQRVLFNLDDVDIWGGVNRAASGRGGATDWELLQIYQNPNLWNDTLEFWQGGQRVANPFE